MKTALAYVLGFSMTFTVIGGGMYFLSSKYPWMFGTSGDKGSDSLKSTVTLGTTIAPQPESEVQQSDSSKGSNETINTLKSMLAEKNDSLAAKDDSIQHMNDTLTQLQKKNSDANTMIAQLQEQVNSWNSERRKELASAYNDMDPVVAAKIMKNLSDRDILFVLSSVQKKQAAKILAELDPARVAKLMTGLGPSK
ncbi:MAG: MotE family protein [Candidatus Kryptoniota bacterium]